MGRKGKVMIHNGRILIRRGKVAVSPTCCCGEVWLCNDNPGENAPVIRCQLSAPDCELSWFNRSDIVELDLEHQIDGWTGDDYWIGRVPYQDPDTGQVVPDEDLWYRWFGPDNIEYVHGLLVRLDCQGSEWRMRLNVSGALASLAVHFTSRNMFWEIGAELHLPRTYALSVEPLDDGHFRPGDAERYSAKDHPDHETFCQTDYDLLARLSIPENPLP